MTDAKRSDQPEGAQNPPQSDPTQQGIAASREGKPRIVAPLSTPFPSIPAPPSEAEEEAEEALTITEAEFEGAVGHDESRQLKAQNARVPSAWVQGPGAIEVLVEGCKVIRWAARQAGEPISQIEAVFVKALPKVNKVLVKAVEAGSAGAIETYSGGNGAVCFTISDILREAGMQLETGARRLFPVKKVASSPIGPAMAIMMGAKPLASRRVETKKRKKK